MAGNSPTAGKNFGQKQNSFSESKNCVKNRKASMGMSLLSMWKIESSQKSSTESAEDDIFLPSKNFKVRPKKVKVSPKKLKVSPKPYANMAGNSESNGMLEYCPNCQMPFSALVKQSQNWHLAECMDFNFQHLKECPTGELCSSTIPSHYTKYTHYGLAKLRSGVPQTAPRNSATEKLHCSSSSGKIKSRTLTLPIKPKNSFPKQADSSLSQNTSLSMSNQRNFGSSLCSDPKNTDPNKFSVQMSSCSKVLSNKTEEKCKQSFDLFHSAQQSYSEQSSNLGLGVHNSTTTTGDMVKATSYCGESYQEFKIPNSVPLNTVSPMKIVSPEVEKNQNEVVECKQSKRTHSPMEEELICSKSGDFSSSQFSPGFSDAAKEAVCGVQRSIKRMKLDDSLSSANNFSPSDDSCNVSEAKVFGEVCSQGLVSFRKSPDLLCSKPGSNDANVNGSDLDAANIYDLANEWFPLHELDTGYSTKTNSNSKDDSEEELFVIKNASDMSRKTMVQTVITKTSSTSDNSFNITLSPVKPEQLTPKKKKNIRSASLPRSPSISAKTEPVISPRKKQTSLMSFFKSSSSLAENTQKMTFVESPSAIASNKSSQNRWGKVFQERKTLNIGQQEQNNDVQLNRKCPYYRKIPGTTFVVDAFNYGSIPGIQHYFLSHFHYDHYEGLTKNFQHPVYCSMVTANLVIMKIRLPKKYINILKLNETTMIENVAVTVLDANHCPGSVMFLFGFRDGRFMLHTGDFRATPAMELYPPLRSCRIDRLFLDTTYCNPRYDFPSQDSILDMLTSLVVPRMKDNNKLLVVCGSYTIGKERAFMAIAESVDCKIWAEPSKRNVLKCLEDQRISSRLVTTESLAKIHVRPMRMIKISLLRQYLLKYSGIFNEIIGLKPTGWEHTSGGPSTVLSLKPICQGPVTIYGIPYSEHSSFSELKKFVQFLKPKHIIPTVNVSSAESRSQMELHFKQWHVK